MNPKCQHFESLYHGSVKNAKYCSGTNVSQEYLCPKVSQGGITEMPMNPWFQKQSGCSQTGSDCLFARERRQLGHNPLCRPLKPSPPPELPSRAVGLTPNSDYAHKDLPAQKGGYVFTSNPQGHESEAVCHPDPYQNYPAQDGYYLERCIGNRNLYPNRQQTSAGLKRACPPQGFNRPIPPVTSKPPVPSLTKRMIIDSADNQVSVRGKSNPSYNLPLETSDETMMEVVNNYNITPTYYNDMTFPAIGKRPVITSRNLENDVPHILVHNRPNMIGRDAGCRQPTWRPKCV